MIDCLMTGNGARSCDEKEEMGLDKTKGSQQIGEEKGTKKK